jgi:hypothetical protein
MKPLIVVLAAIMLMACAQQRPGGRLPVPDTELTVRWVPYAFGSEEEKQEQLQAHVIVNGIYRLDAKLTMGGGEVRQKISFADEGFNRIVARIDGKRSVTFIWSARNSKELILRYGPRSVDDYPNIVEIGRYRLVYQVDRGRWP